MYSDHVFPDSFNPVISRVGIPNRIISKVVLSVELEIIAWMAQVKSLVHRPVTQTLSGPAKSKT